LDIQRWFAIESPKEMSETFALFSAIYYIAEVGGVASGWSTIIERKLDEIRDPSEWFASCMYLEDLRQNRRSGVRWAPVQ
jgi:hypothetical protein